MRILRPVGEEIQIDDKVRHLLFNINVIDEIQEHYDEYIVDVINSLFNNKDKKKQKQSYSTMVYILLTLLNEDVRLHNKRNPQDMWEELTEEFLKEEVVTNETSMTISLLILKAFNGTLPKSEGDSDPNLKGGQAKK